jgi:hypothetical protein
MILLDRAFVCYDRGIPLNEPEYAPVSGSVEKEE